MFMEKFLKIGSQCNESISRKFEVGKFNKHNLEFNVIGIST
jgi:hypothetical protein